MLLKGFSQRHKYKMPLKRNSHRDKCKILLKRYSQRVKCKMPLKRYSHWDKCKMLLKRYSQLMQNAPEEILPSG
jgi:hypothetical protein